MIPQPAIMAAARRAVIAHVFEGAPAPTSPYDKNTRRHRIWQFSASTALAEAERFKHLFSDLPIKVQLVEPAA
ncbi:hypothetical protein [Novosphingobium sp. SG707]|uniref:hypothetical protein n=1 Tax=Novosphingobium sp. SG707 TaxID=2586996 RepID=UPI00144816B4|nr:hypothetical protein [Novosphingobium sp. SG707]NKI99621.1 hypothetical protein [Novosphingobium sp. SG707]